MQAGPDGRKRRKDAAEDTGGCHCQKGSRGAPFQAEGPPRVVEAKSWFPIEGMLAGGLLSSGYTGGWAPEEGLQQAFCRKQSPSEAGGSLSICAGHGETLQLECHLVQRLTTPHRCSMSSNANNKIIDY